MIKKLLYATLIIIVSFLSFTSIVRAEEYLSELIPKGVPLDVVEVGKIKTDGFGLVVYFDTVTKKSIRFELKAQFTNSYTEATVTYFTVYFYDKNQNLLFEYNEDVNVEVNRGGTLFHKFYNHEDGFDLDDVVYYQIKLEIPVKTKLFDGAEKGAYFFDEYKAIVNVNENNIYDIEQTFKGIFKGSSRAITIFVPMRHIYESNDVIVNKRAIVDNLKISDKYTKEIKKGNNVLTIGQTDTSVLEKNYDIAYSYNVGKDIIDGQDVLVVYLIRNLDASVNGINFEIAMPKEFDKDKVIFIDEDDQEIEDVIFDVEDNVIRGEYKNIIPSNSSFAIKVLLPDNYFVGASSNISDNTKIAFIVPVVFSLVTIIIYLVSNRKKNKIHETVGLYLEEDIDSLELGYILKGEIKENDIASLIFCLANKKFLEIEVNGNNYTITKVRDYTGFNRLEEIIMRKLFQNEDVITRKNLKENLRNVKAEIEKSLLYKKKKRFFNYPIINYKLLFWVMIFIIYYLEIKNMIFEYEPKFIFIVSFAGFMGLALILSTLPMRKLQKIEKVLCSLAGVVLIISPIILTSYEAFVQDNLSLSAYLAGLMCIAIISITSGLLSNRTMYGNYLYRKIVAYKEVLTNIDNDIIVNEIVNNNDMFFYDVLPYIFVFGISDRFYEKFENIPLVEPKWYGVKKFNFEEFYEQVKNIYSDVYLAIKMK